MGLAERLAAGVPARQSRFDYVLAQLLPDEQAALLAAALDPSWSDEALTRVLQDEGVIVGAEAVSAWRAAARAAGKIPDAVPLPPDVVIAPPVRGIVPGVTP